MVVMVLVGVLKMCVCGLEEEDLSFLGVEGVNAIGVEESSSMSVNDSFSWSDRMS